MSTVKNKKGNTQIQYCGTGKYRQQNKSPAICTINGGPNPASPYIPQHTHEDSNNTDTARVVACQNHGTLHQQPSPKKREINYCGTGNYVTTVNIYRYLVEHNSKRRLRFLTPSRSTPKKNKINSADTARASSLSNRGWFYSPGSTVKK